MNTHFYFYISLPLLFVNPKKFEKYAYDELLEIINETDIVCSGTEFDIPDVPVKAIYSGVADYSNLPEILKNFTISPGIGLAYSSFVYDIHGLDALKHYFNCDIAYDCIDFVAQFSVTEETIEPSKINYELDEDEEYFNLWAVDLYDSHWDPETGFELTKLNYNATHIFSEIFIEKILEIIAIFNLCKPGCFNSQCLFIDRYSKDDSGKFISNMPNINYKIIQNFSRYEISIWHELNYLNFKEVWQWYSQISDSENNIMRALNRYFKLFITPSHYENLVHCVSALEALFVMPFTDEPKNKREPSKQRQLRENIPLLIDVSTLFPEWDFSELISEIYDQRSRIVHGDKDLEYPFRFHRGDEYLHEITSYAATLLVISLRNFFQRNI